MLRGPPKGGPRSTSTRRAETVRTLEYFGGDAFGRLAADLTIANSVRNKACPDCPDSNADVPHRGIDTGSEEAAPAASSSVVLDAIVAASVDLATKEKTDTPPALIDAGRRRR